MISYTPTLEGVIGTTGYDYEIYATYAELVKILGLPNRIDQLEVLILTQGNYTKHQLNGLLYFWIKFLQFMIIKPLTYMMIPLLHPPKNSEKSILGGVWVEKMFMKLNLKQNVS